MDLMPWQKKMMDEIGVPEEDQKAAIEILADFKGKADKAGVSLKELWRQMKAGQTTA